ncbi:MAG: PrsW family intramembrane metalloprotease, partial [Candidatus Dormibacteraeota bacterium]|nr:PrsW family intramembrane metalloprotease [Candidatus Dormibacteraeota bacterium]
MTDSSVTPTRGTPVGGYDVRTGRSSSRHRWRWLWTLLLGAGLWIVCIIVTAITRNTNLIPANILLGSFMVPVAAVAWNFDHRADSYLPMTRIFYAFVVGGTLGVLVAAILEAPLGHLPAAPQFILVGLIEEAAKLGALIVVAQRLRRYTTTDGLVLGATVGFGFAALESSGYAFNALLTAHGFSLPGLVETVILRGVLAPLGHGLWTAILGLFLFHAAERRNRLRISWPLVGMYFAMVGLHFAWDFSSSVAAIAGVTVVVVVVLAIGFDLVVGAAGLGVLWLSWHQLVRAPRLRAQQAPPGGSQTAASAQWQQPPTSWPP